MRRIIAIVAALLLTPAAALAQSSPGLVFGQVPTAAQWNSYFAAKQDVLGFTPVNKSGDVMLGELITAPSTTSLSGFNIAPGATVTTPQVGDLYVANASGITLFFHAGTNENFAFRQPILYGSGLALGSVNDANNLLQPLEIRATLTALTQGPVVIANNAGITPSNTQFLVTGNGTAVNGAITGVSTLAQFVGNNSVIPIMLLQSFAANSGVVVARSDGTAASQSALASSDVIGGLYAYGWDGANWINGGRFICTAAAAWSSGTAASTFCSIYTVPSGTQTQTEVVRIQASGGLSIGSGNVGNDQGNGNFLASTVVTVPTTVGSLGTCNSGNKGARRFVTDANANTFHTTAASGGANNVAVVCDGTNWYID